MKRQEVFKTGLWWAVALLLGACGLLGGEDTAATYEYELVAFATEAAGLEGTMAAGRERVEATAVAAETAVAGINAVNVLLLGTVQAVEPPTPAVVRGDSSALLEGGVEGLWYINLPQAEGGMQIVRVNTASSVTEQGCTEVSQNVFAASLFPRVYLVLVMENIPQGTVVGVDWEYEGQLMQRASWTSPNFRATDCVSFFIDQVSVSFRAGSWTATLSINNEVIVPVPFAIREG